MSAVRKARSSAYLAWRSHFRLSHRGEGLPYMMVRPRQGSQARPFDRPAEICYPPVYCCYDTRSGRPAKTFNDSVKKF